MAQQDINVDNSSQCQQIISPHPVYVYEYINHFDDFSRSFFLCLNFGKSNKIEINRHILLSNEAFGWTRLWRWLVDDWLTAGMKAPYSIFCLI